MGLYCHGVRSEGAPKSEASRAGMGRELTSTKVMDMTPMITGISSMSRRMM
jgi:hypothetical protein